MLADLWGVILPAAWAESCIIGGDVRERGGTGVRGGAGRQQRVLYGVPYKRHFKQGETWGGLQELIVAGTVSRR
jgi:hypothetical protein